jgi:predicted flap endonuclease-1-like 5' DNA nuclease
VRVETPDRVQLLRAECARLAADLDGVAEWSALIRLAESEARGDWRDGAELAAERARLKASLDDNRMYLAWSKLGEVIALLEAEVIAPTRSEAPVVTRLAAVEAAEIANARPGAELTRIRGIDAVLAERLACAGVARVADMAALTAKDVRRLRTTLGLGRRISQEVWIEQAALLQMQPHMQPQAVPAEVPSIPAPDPVPLAVSPAVAEPAAPVAATSTPQASPLPAKPASLTARLFARTPIVNPHRSLLAAIEAAETARTRRPAPASDPTPALSGFGAQPLATQADGPSPPAEAPVMIPARGEDEALGTPRRPRASRSEREAKAAAKVAAAPVEQDLPQPGRSTPDSLSLAPVEEEAEVVIVSRTGQATPRPRSLVRGNAAREADPILPIDAENQGGEGYDSRSLAAYRGTLEEASVEIVVRKPASGRG